jgi:uncharacterized protein DUF6448
MENLNFERGRCVMKKGSWKLALIAAALLVFTPGRALGHCDGMDGPVVKAAQRALETGNVNLVLIWVQKADETDVRKAFDQTMRVRKLNPEARELADRYFFEALVRLHRAGEGAPYTGLKPAGRDLGPAIPAADKALEDRTVDPLVKVVNGATEKGLREHFQSTISKANFNKDDVEAGRAYVKAYVEFIHYAERMYEAASKAAPGHYTEAEDHQTYGR